MNMDSRKYGPLKHIEKAFLMGEEGFSFDWFLGKPAASTIYGFANVNRTIIRPTLKKAGSVAEKKEIL